MAMFEKTIDHAKDSLAQVSREAIDRAGERLADVVKVGVSQAGTELKDVIWEASQEIDAKLEKISDELHAHTPSGNSPRTMCASWSITRGKNWAR